jgi:catechol 2,3-dioxygenase-like lactoylglutathione lyase family enzyme
MRGTGPACHYIALRAATLRYALPGGWSMDVVASEELDIMDLAEPVTEPGYCHRLAVAVHDLQATTRWLVDVLGATLLPVSEQAGGAVDAQDDGGFLTILWLQNVPVVALAPSDPAGTVARYLARNGPGVHSLAWEIPDMWRTENLLRAGGVTIVGTDIPGRHFFMHPRHTHGLLLEYTDDKLPGDPRHGAPDPLGTGTLPVRSVAWVTAVVDDLDAALECLRLTFGAEVVSHPPAGATEKVADLRIGDMTLRLAVPSSPDSPFAGAVAPGAGRYHSVALAVDDFAGIDAHLAAAGIGTVARDATTVWTDPRDTMGLQFQLVDAVSLPPG